MVTPQMPPEVAQSQRQYKDGALELALNGNGPGLVRLRNAVALFKEALGRVIGGRIFLS